MSNNIINHINNSLDTDEKLKSFFGWNKQYNDYKNNQQTAFNENYNNASWIEKRAIEAGQTFNDILGSLLAGALKQTEGIYDAGAQLASVVTGKMGNKELSKSILESLKKDATQTTLSMFDLDNNSKSWVNNIPGKAPDIIRGVGQGVGQVGMTAAFAKLGGKTAATAALFLGAYGNSLESSLNEGASMKDATVYSTLSAGVELFTERMFGGVSGKFLGNGMLDKYVNKYASSTLAKLAMDAAGEGFEEAFAEAVQPFLKMTYNDKDIKETWNDATSEQQFEQILDSAIVGALTSVAFGGATGQYTAKSMAESSVSEIKAIEKQQSNLYKNNTLTEQKLSSIDGSIQYHLKTYNKQLNRIETVEDKLKYIKDMGMESYYDENAKLREVNTSERSAMNFTAFKSSKRIEGLKLAKEVSEAQSNVLRLGEKLGKKVVVAEMEDGINGYFDPDTQTIVVSSKATNPTEVFVHELTHKLEGTEQYSNYVRYLINAIENNDNLKSKVLGNRITLEAIENAYKGQIKGMDKKSKDYVVLTEFVAKATSEALFTDSKSIERLVITDKNIAEKIYDWIKAQVKKIKNPSTPEERAYLSMLKKAEKLYSDAIENEVGGVRLSDISGASNENNRFSRADLRIASIQKAFANQLLNSESVFLDFTPIFLQKLGLNNDVLTITQNHLAKIVKAPKDSYNGEHAIPLVYIEKQLIEDLNDPMLAFDLGNNKVGIMSDYLDVDGSPVYIPIKYSVTSIVNNVTIDSNHITSVYGRDAFAQYINQNFSKIIYINKQKTRALFSSSGNIYPNQLNALVDKTILQQVGNNVNINDKVQDSEGDLLSNEQIDFFKNSKVRDKKGNLKVLFHGTNSPDFTVFNKNKISSNFPNNPKTGFFFTDKRDSARYYAGNNGIIKEVYLNLENPLIIKVKDNTPTASIYYSNNAVQIASDISKGNHDGAIIMHKHRNLYIALESNQIKNTTNLKPTSNDDIRLSIDSRGVELTKEQQEFFKDSKVLDVDGNLLVVYHGTKNIEFNEFDGSTVRKDNMLGKGFYFSTSNEIASKYGNRTITAYLNLKNPFKTNSKFPYFGSSLSRVFTDAELKPYINQKSGTVKPESINNLLMAKGYDGIMTDGGLIVAFESNQIKLVTNRKPTNDKDIRFSLNESQINVTGKAKFGTYTKQQVNKIIANRVNQKYYNRADAEVVINTALTDIITVPEGKVTISNKNFEQVVRELWDVLNTKQPGNRLGYALQIAEYIVDNAYAQKMIDTSADRKNLELLATLNQYKKRIDLEAITQDLNTALGNNKQPFNTWGKRSTTTEFMSMDQVVSELKANGIELKGANAVEMFIDLNKMYTEATKEVKRQINAIKNELTKEERHDAIQEITRSIMNTFETKGTMSTFKKQLNSYISKINVLREQLDKAYKVNKAVNNLLATINKVEGLEKYRSVELYPLSMEIVSGIKTLKKVRTWRGNLNNANAVRELFKKYSTKVVDIEGKMIPLYEIYHRINNGETFDTPFGDMIDAIAAGEGELSLDEIKAIDAILLNFIHNVKNQDTIFFQNRSQSETEVATRAIEETKQAVPIAQSGWKYGLGKYTRWLQAPYWRMRRLSNYNNSGYFSQMFNEFKDGFSKQAGFKMNVVKHFEEFFKAHKDVVSKWREPIMIEFDRTMSKGQIISLILTSKRKQAKMHLFNTSTGQGTIRLSNEKLATKKRMKDALLQGQDMSISDSFIERLESQLNDTDKAFIKLADEFFNDISKKAKIETDNAIFGVSNVVDDNYFPLKIADDQIYKQLGDNEMDFKNLFSVYNASFNKAVRKNANNKVVIENVLDVINRHTEQMASYYGLAIPMKTFNRVWNKKTDLSEKLMVEVQKVDPEFQSYMVKLFKDMQGVGIERDGFDKFLSKVRGWSARAALGANPKVLATQFASLFSAHAVGFKYASLLKGLSMGFARKTDYETLYKYSPILYDRAREGNNIDVGLLKEGTGVVGKIDNLTNLTTKPIGMIDNLVVGSVWNAALDQLKDKYSGEELYREAALMTEKAVIVTQANYSPLFRPSILRTQSSALQLVTMFMSEPLQLYSQISGAIDMIKTAKANLKNGKIDKTEAQKQVDEAYKQAKTIAVSVVVNATYLVLLTQAFKWIKGQDDEDETFIESMLNELLGHFIGMFPIVRDAYSMLEGYDVQNMYETGLTNVAKALQDMYQLVDVVVNDKAEDTKTMMAAFRRTLLGLSQTFGVPVRNIETYTKGIIEKFNESAIYKYEDIFFEQSYVKDLQKAIENGDDKMITTVIDAMFNSKNTEFTSKEIVKEVSRLTVAGYSIKPYTAPMEITVDDEVVKLTGTQYRKFKSIYGQADDQVEALLNNRNYSRLDDEQKAKAIRMLYNYYYNLAKEEVTGESFTGKLGLLMNGLNPDKVAVILAYSSDTSMKGLTRRQAVTYQMKNMGFSLQQRNSILQYLGYAV